MKLAAPVELGRNCTANEQVAFAANTNGAGVQVFDDTMNAPVVVGTGKPVRVTCDDSWFVSVTVNGADVAPRGTLPKSLLVADTVT